MTLNQGLVDINYEFLDKLRALSYVQKIILYGSRARGDNKERSDIDLAIECPDATSEQWNIVMDIVDNADSLLKIDCVRYDSLSDENPLKHSIINEGRMIYKKL